MDSDAIRVSRAWIENAMMKDNSAMSEYFDKVMKSKSTQELDEYQKEISILMGRIQMAVEILRSAIIPELN